MRKFLLLSVLLSTFTFAQVGNYNVGDVVDDFTVTDIDGNVHNLYEITASGKYVFLDFFFTTCVPCQQTTPIFNEFHDKYGCNEGEIFAISISGYPADNDANVRIFEDTYGGTFNHAPAVSPDGGGAIVDENFGISAYPTYCIIGPDNTLVNRDIWPINGVETFEGAFPTGFEPEPMECTVMAVTDLNAGEFMLYPTVSNGTFTVSLADSSKLGIEIYNLNGARVFSNSYTSVKDVDLNLKLAPGVYILKAEIDGKVSTKRFVIK